MPKIFIILYNDGFSESIFAKDFSDANAKATNLEKTRIRKRGIKSISEAQYPDRRKKPQ